MSLLKENMKIAIRSLKYNYKRYICIIVLIVILQSLFSSVITIGYNNDEYSKNYLLEKYSVEDSQYDGCNNYHIILKNLNELQMNDLQNYNIRIQTKDEFFYIVYAPGQNTHTSDGFRYDAYIYFYDADNPSTPPERLYNFFINTDFYNSLSEQGTIDVFVTPLLKYDSQKALNTSILLIILLIVVAAGALMFTVLYSTIINHYSFTYGIYMSFGAGFGKLSSTSVIEMLIINTVSLPFSIILSIFSSGIIFSAYETSKIYYPSIPISFILCVIITIIGVLIVIKRISVKAPVKLLREQDNSSLISSVKKSKNILDYRFPRKLEMLSFKRYRKYYIKLILSTVIFAAVFVCGKYIADISKVSALSQSPQFRLTFPENTVTGKAITGNDLIVTTVNVTTSDPTEATPIDASTVTQVAVTASLPSDNDNTPVSIDLSVIDEIASYEQVDKIIPFEKTPASEIISFILLDKKSKTLSAGTPVKYDSDSIGFANVNYCLYDKRIMESYVKSGYTINGRYELVESEENYIIISDSYLNEKRLNIKPGDTVKIAIMAEKLKPLDAISSDYNGLLRLFLDHYVFEYIDYTVAAVISDMPSGESFDIYISGKDYHNVTDKEALFTGADIILKDATSHESISAIDKKLRLLADKNGMTVLDLDAKTNRELTELKSYPGIITYISILFLAVTVLVWMMSQILYYSKRKDEIDIYYCLGANTTAVRKLFAVDAFFNIIMSASSLAVFTLLLVWLGYSVSNRITLEAYRASFSLPIGASVSALSVVVLCSIVSVFISYILYEQKCSDAFTGKKKNITTKND